MTDAKDPRASPWPLPQFYFTVDFGDGNDTTFSEVTGLSETPVIEYRHTNSPTFSTMKMPGLGKTGTVTLHKGVLSRGATFWDWYSRVRLNVISRRTVVIRLRDDSGAPTMVWTLHDAWPIAVADIDVKPDGNDAAVESIELAYETMEARGA